MSATPAGVTLVEAAFDGTVAALLIEEVQQEYVVRYGDRDGAPVDPAQFAPPDGAFLVAMVEGQPAACAGLRRHDATSAEVKRMYVRAAHRRRGLARLMLGAAEERARTLGYARVLLETGDRQPEAVALYAAEGYRPLAGFGHYQDHAGSLAFAKDL